MRSLRGTGRSIRQLQKSRPNALYVWPNHMLDYPKKILHDLGRVDVHVVGPDWFNSPRWRSKNYSELVIDHAAWNMLTDRQLSNIRPAMRYFEAKGQMVG